MIKHWVQNNSYKEAQWAHWELQRIQGKYKELTSNYISMKKDIETINKSQKEMKNTISELKNTVEGIKSRLDEAVHWIIELEDTVGKNTHKEQEKEKKDKIRLRGG